MNQFLARFASGDSRYKRLHTLVGIGSSLNFSLGTALFLSSSKEARRKRVEGPLPDVYKDPKQ